MVDEREEPTPTRSARLGFDPPTTRVRFSYATAFPADNRIGHFVVGLAAAMNDLNLFNSLLFPPDDPERNDFSDSERTRLTLVLLAIVWETHLFVSKASRLSDVAQFLAEVEEAYPSGETFSGTELLAFLKGDAGATAPAMRDVLRIARNATFHYHPVPEKDGKLAEVLTDLADENADGFVVQGDRMPSVRAEFADLVTLRLALRGLAEEDVGQLFSALSETVVSIVHLGQVALDLWLSRSDHSVEAIESYEIS